MKYVRLALACAGAFIVNFSVAAISLDDIQLWAGSGTNRAALVVEWSTPQLLTNTSVAVPLTDKTMVWGYRFNGTANASQMLHAITYADPRLYIVDAYGGDFIEGIGYNLSGNDVIGISDGTTTNYITSGVLSDTALDVDQVYPITSSDLYWSGFNGPNWECWTELGGAGGFYSSPLRGTNAYWTPDDTNNPFYGVHGQWELAGAGATGLTLTDGSWIGFSVAAGADNFADDTDPNTVAYSFHKHAPVSPDGTYTAYVVNTNDFAASVVATSNIYTVSPYNTPAAVLGQPTLKYIDHFTPHQASIIHRSKLAEPPYWTDSNSNNVITEINPSGYITVNMGRRIYDDPANPYGIDFVVYGNSLYSATGFTGQVNDFTDENSMSLSSGFSGHTTIVSVSQDGTNWFNYPYIAGIKPFDSYHWDEGNHVWTDEFFDDTKPLNPSLTFPAGTKASTVMDYFTGASGGTGYDLKASGFPWIQYIRITAGTNFTDTNLFDYTVLDAVTSAHPVGVGGNLSILPANLAAGTTNLFFQETYNPTVNQIAASFSSISDLAKLGTVTLHDFGPFAPVPGTLSGAYQLQLRAAAGSNAVTGQANVSLRAADGYIGDGTDLRVYQWSGSNWMGQPFAFNASTAQATLFNVTNFTAFAITQFIPPILSVQAVTNGYALGFVPIPNCPNILERSSDLTGTWSGISVIAPGDNTPVSIVDTNAAPLAAYYRVRVIVP